MRIFNLSPFDSYPVFVAVGAPWTLVRKFGWRRPAIQWTTGALILVILTILVRLLFHLPVGWL